MSSEEMDIELKVEPEYEQDDPLAVVEDPQPESPEDQQTVDVNVIDNYKKALQEKFLAKVNNVHEKLVIASHVLDACKKEEVKANKTLSEKLQYYTKQPIEYLDEVVKDSYTIPMKQDLEDLKPLPEDVIPYIYGDIRDIFVEYYVKQQSMPSVLDFMGNFYCKRDNSFYRNAKISNLVKNNLVKYNHLPTLERYLLTENPEFAYRRHLYLRQITNYRQTNDIVYVAIFKIETEKGTSVLAVGVSTAAGIIAKSDIIPYVGESYDNKIVKLWIRNELLHKLSTSSIIVIIQERKKDKTPTPFSTKMEMIDWLNERDVTCYLDYHKSKLYNLVRLFQKRNKEQGFFDEVLASSGFQVLSCPVEYDKLNFFHGVVLSVGSETSLVKVLTELTQEEWVMTERKLVEQEKQMMFEDEEMDRIIVNILEMVKNGDVTEEDFPEFCRGTKADNFYVHIGDIIKVD